MNSSTEDANYPDQSQDGDVEEITSIRSLFDDYGANILFVIRDLNDAYLGTLRFDENSQVSTNFESSSGEVKILHIDIDETSALIYFSLQLSSSEISDLDSEITNYVLSIDVGKVLPIVQDSDSRVAIELFAEEVSESVIPNSESP
ncbi:hypothetical protein [Salinispira pacifica]|uniref:hypothetical protein n=1 Tax=Salinispira pacifica TaxID=1307761 RepID=UPI00059DF514|nr:hypothetical protein [Salinispira pacifica]